MKDLSDHCSCKKYLKVEIQDSLRTLMLGAIDIHLCNLSYSHVPLLIWKSERGNSIKPLKCNNAYLIHRFLPCME